jgi:hypothetical protein
MLTRSADERGYPMRDPDSGRVVGWIVDKRFVPRETHHGGE